MTSMNTQTPQDEPLLTENVSREILNIIRYLLSLTVNSSRVMNRRKRMTYLQILKVAMKEHGELILRHLIRYGACTSYELYEIYGINYSTVGRVLKLLEYGELIRQVGFVGKPYFNFGDGRRVKIYVLLDSDPSSSAQAQTRYGEIKNSKRGDTLRQTQLEEAFNVVKLYLDEREIRHIPKKTHIHMILKEHEITGVNHSLLLRKLVKSGYKL